MGLSAKIFRITVLVSLVATSGIAAIEGFQQYTYLNGSERRWHELTLNNISNGVGDAIWRIDKNLASQIISGVFASESIVEVAALEDSGAFFVGFKRDSMGNIVPLDIKHAPDLERFVRNRGADFAANEAVFEQLPDDQVRLAKPLWMNQLNGMKLEKNRLAGFIITHYSNKTIKIMVMKTLARIIVSSLIFLTILLVMMVFFLRREVIRPVHKLVEASNLVAAGNFDHEVGVTVDGELGELACNFDSMRVRVKTFTESLRNVIDDRTAEIARQTMTLREQNEKLQSMDTQKTRFFQNISHELRTPLTLIMGPLEDFTKGRFDLDIAVVAHRNASRLYRLVNQLLDFQKISSHGLSLQKKLIDADDFVVTCASAIEPLCAKRGIRVLTKLAENNGARPKILGDADALEKIIFNYLSNAWKHSPDGGRITVSVSHEGERLRIAVADEGEGIAQGEQERLFSVFFQVDSSATRSHEGSGLGLALVKELTVAMDGVCGVKSEPGQGATFWVEFPCYVVKPVVDILFVDDSHELLDTLLRLFKLPGARVLFAHGPVEARKIIAGNRIKCIVSDAVMPGEDGISLLKHVSEAQPECYRMMMTAGQAPTLFERAINEGAVQATVIKPFQMEKLQDVLVKALAKSPIKDDVAIQGEFKPRDWLIADADSGIETKTVAADATRKERVMVVDDLPDMRDYVARTLRGHGFITDTANGAEVGLGMIGVTPPSLIIVDWMMPKVSGLEFIERLRANPDTASIPVILLTAKSDEESRILGTTTGATAYLSKPFNEAELISTVENLLQLKAKEAEVIELNRKISETVLTRYLPPKVVKDIMAGKLDFDFKVKAETVAVMFADICGFTKATSELGPQKIARVLNQYLVEMSEVIFAHDGLVDKFIGDGIMAIFGAPSQMPPADQAEKALTCAKAMLERIVSLNTRWKNEDLPELQIRIGLHQGPVIIGHFGGTRRSDFTAIGNTVNMASRIEGAAGPGEVFMSNVVRDYLQDDNWAPAGKFKLKGFDGEHSLYKLKVLRALNVA